MTDGSVARDGRVFIVDVARCTGCFACSVACKDRADLPDALDWLRVEANEDGAYPSVSLAFRVVHCFHCLDPVCAAPCPTGAISPNADGWIVIDDALCIGCGACAAHCPFGAIVLDEDRHATKCDACQDELARGWDPTCVRACPMRALYLAEPSALTRARRPDPNWNDHGIGPRVFHAVRTAQAPGDQTDG